MRRLTATNPGKWAPIRLVNMRGKHDCMTCVTAMLLGISYEEVETAFGGNIDPSKDHAEESRRVYWAFHRLIERYKRGILQIEAVPSMVEGRRYWVGVRVN